MSKIQKISKVTANVPDGWKIKRLKETGEAIIGLTYSPKDLVDSGGIEVLRSSNVQHGRIALDDLVRVSAKIPEKIILQEGDILVCARNGSRRLIGKNARINGRNVGKTFGAFMCVYRSNNPFYMYWVFQTESFRKQIARDLGPTINQVTTGNLNSFKFAFPSESEQIRIASVLEVWDMFLEKMDEKIELKKCVKKGLMQQLLTGEKRLPEHDDEWITLTLNEIGDVRTSSVNKLTENTQKQVGLLNYMNVYRRNHIRMTDKFQQVTAKEQQVTSSNLKAGDILFTPSSETQIDIGHSAVVVEDLENILFSYHLIRLRPKNKFLDYRFSAYAFKTRKFYKELWKRAQGATRYTLSKEAIQQSVIKIPRSLNEQVAIARVLETVDAEIQYLEDKKNSVFQQKKYLLNNLVSGKVRTPENLITSNSEIGNA